MLTILNFSHPLTEAQLARIRQLTGEEDLRVFEIKTHFDNDQPFAPQLDDLIARIPPDARALQTEPILIVPPALNFITAMLLAALHGLMGYFPPIIRIAPVAGSLPPRYDVAEIIDLQAIRHAAREER
ncbi:MAG TPA: hypothetical protein EYH29_07190 [Caldilineales bacterium]|nr:hypothetical protein [Caldilineales bacterium]